MKFAFKSLFPIWRFFESGDVVPRVWVQAQDSDQWQPWIAKRQLRLTNLFYNPEVNFELFKYSLSHEISRDLLEGQAESEAISQFLELLQRQFPHCRYRIVNVKAQPGLVLFEGTLNEIPK